MVGILRQNYRGEVDQMMKLYRDGVFSHCERKKEQRHSPHRPIMVPYEKLHVKNQM